VKQGQIVRCTKGHETYGEFDPLTDLVNGATYRVAEVRDGYVRVDGVLGYHEPSRFVAARFMRKATPSDLIAERTKRRAKAS
jgi:hypothetical protein